MIYKLIIWLASRLPVKERTALVGQIHTTLYEPVMLDGLNKKLIRPVPGLIIDGVQYYEFVQPGDMPQGRLVHYSYLRDEMSMGVDRALLLDYISKLRQHNTNTDEARDARGTLLFMLEDTLKNITTIESLYNVASLWYFDAREDLGTYDLDYAQQKIERFKRFAHKGFFFTNLLQHGLRLTGESLPPDILRYLNENAARLKGWERIRSGLGA